MKHYVYKLTHTETSEFYIGVRSCKCEIEKDNYKGSMKVWKPNKSKLKKEILKEFDNREEANDCEHQLLLIYTDKIKYPLNRNYHIPCKGFCNLGKTVSKETKQKMSIAQKGKKYPKLSNEHKQKISLGSLGKERSDEVKLKISTTSKGRKLSKETKQKMSIAQKKRYNKTL